MARPTYSDLLKDPRWQKKRLEILSRDEFRCQQCDCQDKTLHVHHGGYERGVKPWEYDEESLFTLCEDCHKSATENRRILNRWLALLSPCDLPNVIGYVAGQVAYRYEEIDLPCTDIEMALGLSIAQQLDGFVDGGRRAEDLIVMAAIGGVIPLSFLEEMGRLKNQRREAANSGRR